MKYPVASAFVHLMEQDNGCTFSPTPEDLWVLEAAIRRMQEDGARFEEPERRNLFANGEESEMFVAFKGFEGFELANQIMNQIFER